MSSPKMYTRIKYTKQDNLLISKQKFRINNQTCDITIRVDTMAFGIGNGHDTLIAEGQAKTLHEAKKSVKNTLVNLGFRFKKEKRKTRPLRAKSLVNNSQPLPPPLSEILQMSEPIDNGINIPTDEDLKRMEELNES